MKRILTSFAFVAASLAFAQVSITGDADATPRATLDVQAIPNSDKPDGILIPNINKDRAQLMELPETSTLVYMKNDGTGGDRTVNVDADGFYYFDRTAGTSGEWVKVGGGAAANPFLGNTKGKIRVLPSNELMTADTWQEDDFALVVTYLPTGQSPALPDPTGDNANRIIAVVNLVGKSVTFTGNTPLPGDTLRKSSGAIYMSDGINWYQIASF